MRRYSPPINFLGGATITDATVMSSRPPYRGGRRGFCGGIHDGGQRGQLVTGDSHFQSVRDTNLGFRNGNQGGSFSNQQSPHINQNPQHLSSQNPQFHQPSPIYQNRSSRQPPPQPFNQNQAFRRPRQYVSGQKPADYRNWEYAGTTPPPNSDKFVVLSYNVLADYLAINHRSKLYFHIPHDMLNWQWRKRSIMIELRLWSADIMCLQEVDMFKDLSEGLKIQGYNGIWKMRTGDAVDGCAIFWRASRFKLVHEECIEFKKLGLRDNVAQICVLELLSSRQDDNRTTTSTAGCKRVVVCNIHVLYNPKRGDIKLGQVRLLLDKAQAVSKIWNNSPLVLCGDFNCTPKSPLYNFISEQKLDLCGIGRDKVSGQASAEIHAQRTFSSDNPTRAPSFKDGKEVAKFSLCVSDVHEKNSDCSVITTNNRSQQFTQTVSDIGNQSCVDVQCGNEVSALDDDLNKNIDKPLVDGSKNDTSVSFVPIDSSKGSSNCLSSEDDFPPNLLDPPLVASPIEDVISDRTKIIEKDTSHSNHGSLSEYSDSIDNAKKVSRDDHSIGIRFDQELGDTLNSVISLEVFGQKCSLEDSKTSLPENSTSLSSRSIDNDNLGSSSSNKKIETLCLQETNKNVWEGTSEDDKTFLSSLHGNDDAIALGLGQPVESERDQSSKDFNISGLNPQFSSSRNEVVSDFPTVLDPEAYNVETSPYGPSLWTPMELATATGDQDKTLLEHPLQLKSTYTEVKDCSNTRDLTGEPFVTSYNRCFMGTVDYIWRSKGLQTVKVLAPIPKHAMKWTKGFPTKKWGSDHIALVSELAFVKDLNDCDER